MSQLAGLFLVCTVVVAGGEVLQSINQGFVPQEYVPASHSSKYLCFTHIGYLTDASDQSKDSSCEHSRRESPVTSLHAAPERGADLMLEEFFAVANATLNEMRSCGVSRSWFFS